MSSDIVVAFVQRITPIDFEGKVSHELHLTSYCYSFWLLFTSQPLNDRSICGHHSCARFWCFGHSFSLIVTSVVYCIQCFCIRRKKVVFSSNEMRWSRRINCGLNWKQTKPQSVDRSKTEPNTHTHTLQSKLHCRNVKFWHRLIKSTGMYIIHHTQPTPDAFSTDAIVRVRAFHWCDVVVRAHYVEMRFSCCFVVLGCCFCFQCPPAAYQCVCVSVERGDLLYWNILHLGYKWNLNRFGRMYFSAHCFHPSLSLSSNDLS